MLARNIARRGCSRKISQLPQIHRPKILALSPPLPLTQLIIEHFVLRPATNRTRRSSDHDCSPSMPALQESEPAKERGRYRRQICAPTTVALANRLRQTAIVRAALARKRTGQQRARTRHGMPSTSWIGLSSLRHVILATMRNIENFIAQLLETLQAKIKRKSNL